MKTIAPVTMMFGKGRLQYEITVPAGTRIRSCGDGTGQYFVEDLSWLDRSSITWHDANYYGIRLSSEQAFPQERYTAMASAIQDALGSNMIGTNEESVTISRAAYDKMLALFPKKV